MLAPFWRNTNVNRKTDEGCGIFAQFPAATVLLVEVQSFIFNTLYVYKTLRTWIITIKLNVSICNKIEIIRKLSSFHHQYHLQSNAFNKEIRIIIIIDIVIEFS